MKEGEERSSSGIKCAFKMSKAIEDALGRPGENYIIIILLKIL